MPSLLSKKLSKYKGVSALVFDQTCAAEKRRRRKRGLMHDPVKRVMINPDVCEGVVIVQYNQTASLSSPWKLSLEEREK